MEKKLFYTLFLLFFILNCSKPDPTPELKDFIYQDYIEQKGLTEKTLIEIESKIAEHEKELNEAVPQSGQSKWAKKRLFEAQANKDKLKQQIKYFEIKIIERAKYIRRANADSFSKGETLDTTKETEEYKAEKKLRSAKFTWDHKKRLEEAKGGEKVPDKKEGN